MNNKNLLHKNVLAEKQLISWIAAEGNFIDVPEDYFTNRDLLAIYKAYKSQYYEHGSFIAANIPDSLYTALADANEVYTYSKPDITVTELKKAYMVRRFYREVISAERRIDGEPGFIVEELNALSKKITEMLTEIEEAKEYDHKKSVFQFMQTVEEGKKRGSTMRGFSSHLPDLDRILSGWERGKVYLVSGLEKIGKSRFVRSMVSHWLRHGLGCVMVMLEEDDAAIHECIFANRCEVDTGVIGTAAISDAGMMRILAEGNTYMNEPLYITTKSSATPNYIKTVINRQKVKMKNAGRELCFVVVDYIQRMGGDGTGHEKYELIASQLADITRDENVCMIQISQVNASAEKTKGLPLHTQIRFGKVFKEAASCIITFDDPERQGKGDDFNPDRGYKTLNAHIIQRRGLSNVTIGIRSELQYSRFDNFA